MACSSSVSTSFSVETWDWLSTTRQRLPAQRLASDASAGGIHIFDSGLEPGDALDQVPMRLVSKSPIGQSHPATRTGLLAPSHCIEAPEQSDEEQRQFIGFARRFQREGARLQARDGGV